MTIKSRNEGKATRHRRVRKKISGTPEKPRLAVFRSLRHISGQVIDDTTGQTLVSVTTCSSDFNVDKCKSNIATAIKAGKLIGEKMKEKGILAVVFDRGGCLYHGRVKAFAEATKEVGIKF
jgi:large subunit ribosomal protein L18